MTQSIYNYPSYRDFLKERFQFLKSIKPHFSARYFAKKAKIGSPSYFNLVAAGKRRLSHEYAERFAQGLELNQKERDFLLLHVAIENCRDQARKVKLLGQLESLKKREKTEAALDSNHIKILSDLLTLKIYLLGQSKQFKMSNAWLVTQLGGKHSEKTVEKRVNLLIQSGLWKLEGQTIAVLAPSIKTGDIFHEKYLLKTHLDILAHQRKNLKTRNGEERVVGARTFLFDKSDLPKVRSRIEAFRKDLEAEFEQMNSTHVYQLAVSFHELIP